MRCVKFAMWKYLNWFCFVWFWGLMGSLFSVHRQLIHTSPLGLPLLIKHWLSCGNWIVRIEHKTQKKKNKNKRSIINIHEKSCQEKYQGTYCSISKQNSSPHVFFFHFSPSAITKNTNQKETNRKQIATIQGERKHFWWLILWATIHEFYTIIFFSKCYIFNSYILYTLFLHYVTKKVLVKMLSGK